MESHQVLKDAFDNSIDESEAEEIRQHWDKLKCYAEGFVRCSEEGNFKKMKEDPDQKPQAEPRRTLY
jgi:hypothetical protein